MSWSPAAEPWLTLTVAVAFCLAALLLPNFSRRFLCNFERLLARAARHKFASAVLLFLFVVGVRLALLPRLPVPNPGIHDEFSYLLMADTFAHGRLANPTHPMWRSFETFHVLWHPTYASKYPPAQGAALAFGQVLRHPWIGVLLSTAAMCVAIFWSLRPFMPSRWALLAALLAFLRLGVASYWMNSYWGGSIAAVGGALVLGGAGRILRDRQSIWNPVLVAIDLAILANSRPYEGLMFCAPVMIALLWWLSEKAPRAISSNVVSPGVRWRQIALPILGIGVATLIFMAYYNWRITRNPLLMPHVLAARQYDRSALFVWQRAKPPIEVANPQLDEFYNGWERENYDRTWRDFRRISWEKWWRCRSEFLWPGLLLAIPGIFFIWRDRHFRLPLLALATTLLAFALLAWWNPHYIAPATCVLFGVMAHALRHLRTMDWRRRPIGRALVFATIVLLASDVALQVRSGISDPLSWGGWGLSARADLQKALEQKPGKHLIVVRYSADHSVHEEWVYNGADIDAQKVIWARELDPAQNARLLAFYKDRNVWLVEPDENDSELKPFSPPPN